MENVSNMNSEQILENLLNRYPTLDSCSESIKKAFEVLKEMYRNGGTLYTAGNGGSAADSEHIVGELMKSFMFKRPIGIELKENLGDLFGTDGAALSEKLEGGLPAVSLPSLTSLATAIANDVNGEMVFAQMINSIASKNDVFLGISTSGNSKNIINAIMVAKAKGVTTIGLSGQKHSKMDILCDVVIHAPETETYKIQELHLPIYHALCAMLEAEFFG